MWRSNQLMPNILDKISCNNPELALEEIRSAYDREESRRRNVENKLGVIATIDGLIFSVLSITSQKSFLSKSLFIIPAMLSALIGIWILKNREYSNPLAHNDIFGVIQNDEEDETKKLVNNYRASIDENSKLNDKKYDALTVCLFLTTLSLIAFLYVASVDNPLLLLREIFFGQNNLLIPPLFLI